MSPDEILAGLDDDQRAAAEALNGPVCILAGAGTGKTRAITHRIAYGVATGAYAANRVMALTFTARAAAELRARLRGLGATGVQARTFHAAALSQLSYFWPQVVGGTAPAVVESKASLLAHAAERIGLKVDTATLRDAAGEIEWRKVSGLGLDDYAARSGGRSLPGQLDLDRTLALQRSYEDLKTERRQLDFEDVLLVTAGMIEQEESVALQVREQYRYFVVDEYQDVSPLQHQLLQLWVGDREQLCVVGDASQTIYSFAGATAQYLLGFRQEHPDAALVRLERNYRSSHAVIDTANALMRGRAGALTLHPATPDAAAGSVARTDYASDIAEARGVAQRVHELVASGARADSIAVLYRINVQAAALEQAFSDAGLGYQIRGARRFFDLPEVKQAVLALRAASVSITGEPLFKSVSDVLRGVGWSQDPPEGRGAVRERWEALNAIMGLVDELPPGTTFRAFTDELLDRQAHQHEPSMDAVTFATLHSAKGLEWEHVFLIGLSEGLLPISHARSLEEIDEERRLFYVGLTRARTGLQLSFAETGAQQRAPRSPSRFLAELGSRSRDASGSGGGAPRPSPVR